MIARFTRLAVLCLVFPTSAAEVHLRAPAGVVQSEPVSVYAAASPHGDSLATLELDAPADIAPGRYVYGIGGRDWRSPPFELSEAPYEIELGALAINAPEEAAATFAVFGAPQNRLIGSALAGRTTAIPPGPVILRRDLAQRVLLVEIAAGSVTTVELGAIRLSAPAVPPGQIAYLATRDSLQIAAAIRIADAVVAVDAGDYLLSAGPTVAPAEVSVAIGEVSTVELGWVDWRDAAGAPEARLRGAPESLPAESAFAAPTGPQAVVVDGTSLSFDVPPGVPLPLWRFEDGTLSTDVGLRLRLPANALPVLPGGNFEFELQLLGPAALSFALTIGEETYALDDDTQLHNMGRMAIAIPEGISREGDAAIIVTDPSGVLMGRLEGLSIHQAPTRAVDQLTVAEQSTTAIELSWVYQSEPGAAGVSVFRGSDPRPVSGVAPLTARSFRDIGLSADREYAYRVCVVDIFGQLGPCADLTTQTLGR